MITIYIYEAIRIRIKNVKSLSMISFISFYIIIKNLNLNHHSHLIYSRMCNQITQYLLLFILIRTNRRHQIVIYIHIRFNNNLKC
jgi:hypothetical protein